jgi:hypothetical protein
MRAKSDTDPVPHRTETARFFFTAPRAVPLLIDAAICTVRRHLERQTGRLPTQGEAPDGLTFELGLRAAGPPLAH